MGCHFLLQGIVPVQRSNSSLLHCRFFTAEPPGKPQINYTSTEKKNLFPFVHKNLVYKIRTKRYFPSRSRSHEPFLRLAVLWPAKREALAQRSCLQPWEADTHPLRDLRQFLRALVSSSIKWTTESTAKRLWLKTQWVTICRYLKMRPIFFFPEYSSLWGFQPGVKYLLRTSALGSREARGDLGQT